MRGYFETIGIPPNVFKCRVFFHKIFDFDFRLFRSVFCHFSYHFRIIWPQAIHFFESSSFFLVDFLPCPCSSSKTVQFNYCQPIEKSYDAYDRFMVLIESLNHAQSYSRSHGFSPWFSTVETYRSRSLKINRFLCRILFTCTLAVVWGLYTLLWLYGLDKSQVLPYGKGWV